MIIQRVLLNCINKDAKELVYLGDSKSDLGYDYPFFISENELISFETYFNVFNIGKYNKYTNLTHISLEILVKGNFKIELVKRNSDLSETVLFTKSKIFLSKDIIRLTVNFNEINVQEEDYLFMRISSISGFVEIYEGRWDSSINTINQVKIAVCICTYKREDYVLKTIRSICDSLFSNIDNYSNKISIIVSDNAGTLDCSEFSNYPVYIVKNKNFGGSGGFTRCLLEVCKSDFTHILMQDDDILLEPECLKRTLTLTELLKTEFQDVSIAGGMFTFETPFIQFEASALWKGKPVSLKHDLDMRYKDALIQNNRLEPADYSAWWYQCMSVKGIKDNYPIPFFIKCDDVEFGLRLHRTIIVMNGICVWHESFLKKSNPYIEYYSTRNALVTNSLCERTYSFEKAIIVEIQLFVRCLLKQKYSAAYFHMLALCDYKKGVNFFLNTNEEDLNNWLRSEDKRVKEIYTKSIEFNNELIINFENSEKKKNTEKSFISAIRVFLNFFHPFRLKYENKIIDISDEKMSNYIGCQSVIHYNSYDKSIYLTAIDKKYFWKILGLFIKEIIPIFILKNKYVADYRRNIGTITSQEFWERHLDI
ncbi:MAG: glycosyltransferase [Anaerorhabdus sp.]|uniref:glycosyltransferase family 2 protein n=1 Tax=Anaerorhabdus sp. TaxID=1872524 RepID=UPI002FC8474F